MALTEALIQITSHGITLNHTEDIDTINDYSVFFRVHSVANRGQWGRRHLKASAIRVSTNGTYPDPIRD